MDAVSEPKFTTRCRVVLMLCNRHVWFCRLFSGAITGLINVELTSSLVAPSPERKMLWFIHTDQVWHRGGYSGFLPICSLISCVQFHVWRLLVLHLWSGSSHMALFSQHRLFPVQGELLVVADCEASRTRMFVKRLLRLGHTELAEILSVSDIRHKWLGQFYMDISVFLCKPKLSETKWDSERISVAKPFLEVFFCVQVLCASVFFGDAQTLYTSSEIAV